MRTRKLGWYRLALLVCAWGFAACGDDGTAQPQDDVASRDTAGTMNACQTANGICTAGARLSNPPGFAIDCGPDRRTADGTSEWFGPGTDLMPGTALNGGCGQQVHEGGEAALFACCYPGPAAP